MQLKHWLFGALAVLLALLPISGVSAAGYTVYYDSCTVIDGGYCSLYSDILTVSSVNGELRLYYRTDFGMPVKLWGGYQMVLGPSVGSTASWISPDRAFKADIAYDGLKNGKDSWRISTSWKDKVLPETYCPQFGSILADNLIISKRYMLSVETSGTVLLSEKPFRRWIPKAEYVVKPGVSVDIPEAGLVRGCGLFFAVTKK